MKYKAIIFDLDGTLTDTLEDLYLSVNYALRSCGLPERSLAEVRRFVGNGVELLLRRALPEGTDAARVREAVAFFQCVGVVPLLDSVIKVVSAHILR